MKRKGENEENRSSEKTYKFGWNSQMKEKKKNTKYEEVKK